jgi:arginyl-tRNA synthetase
VSILRGDQVIAMSKREGDLYLLDTLLDDFGNDAARWFFASRGIQVDIDLDIELAKKQSAENPVYYVQYAHARIASILRKAAEAGLQPADELEGALAGPGGRPCARRRPAAGRRRGCRGGRGDPSHRLRHRPRDLVPRSTATPESSIRAIRQRSATRLALVDATRITLANTLGLLGISAPDVM